MTNTTATATWQKQLNIWYQAARPRSLTATYIPVALGGVMAWEHDQFNLLRFLLALLGVLCLQISANFLNEYFDHKKGADEGKTHGLGMIIARGVLTPRQVLVGGIVTLVLGCLIGLYFVAVTGLLVLWLGVGGAIVVILYTAGPLPLAYIGLGEIAVFIFMGPLIVLGTYYVLAEKVNNDTIWASLPIAFLVANILHANNLRDLEADKARNKRTLAVIFGRRFAVLEYQFLTAGAFVATLILVILNIAPVMTLIVIFLLAEAVVLCMMAQHKDNPAELHQVFVRTARLHRWFGIAYVVGWLIGILI
ncbi:MAG: 1,4-dihydroxy-2-naphthoate octaprenyltransferase [Chloroflexi bacterium]|nr:1,4-dihydroxy-2-naphthoate octaprenyltransferase [Chloroflexota bacterium]